MNFLYILQGQSDIIQRFGHQHGPQGRQEEGHVLANRCNPCRHADSRSRLHRPLLSFLQSKRYG